MLRADELRVSFDGAEALAGVDIAVAEGDRLAVLGPSGSGKSTLLRALAGLEPLRAGRITVDGVDVTTLPAHRRGVGLMLQEGALFPHLDVAGNVGFGLRVAGLVRSEREEGVAEALALVGLEGMDRRSVATLSGGERQRVALARALAPRPRVLLLDEPLGSLDGPLRERLLDELCELFDRLRLTLVHVTHDVGEAFAIGDRIAVMREGRIVQESTPDELWARPVDAWVARFLGLVNLRENGTLVRPEAVRLTPGEGATVVSARRRGATVRLRVRLDDGEELETVAATLEHPAPGERVAVEVDPAGIVRLGADPG
ncbi:MAG: ABC transporter ATP-binding protein [Gaiellaceae bacterium]